MAKVDPRLRRFCEALARRSAGRRPPWWVAIADVGHDLGLGLDAAIALADDCAAAGYVLHDMSGTPKSARLATDLPHSA
jgi:hypothetical protein